MEIKEPQPGAWYTVGVEDLAGAVTIWKPRKSRVTFPDGLRHWDVLVITVFLFLPSPDSLFPSLSPILFLPLFPIPPHFGIHEQISFLLYYYFS